MVRGRGGEGAGPGGRRGESREGRSPSGAPRENRSEKRLYYLYMYYMYSKTKKGFNRKFPSQIFDKIFGVFDCELSLQIFEKVFENSARGEWARTLFCDCTVALPVRGIENKQSVVPCC